MSTDDLPKVGDMAGGRYRVTSRIGAGGMGVVYEAINIATEGRVALKWLAPELTANPLAVDRFKLEARATGRIQHPNVVAIHDIAEENGHLYIVMEMLKGESLRARLSRGPLSLPEALAVLFPVLRGVAAAHGVGVLHRDLKPENIFLAESPDGLDAIPKVLDFGIAKLSSDSEKTQGLTAHTGFLGTYPYMAFEQLHARGNLDARVDVYALGAVLYNSLTGRLPFEADNPVDLALRMMQGLPVSVCEYAPELPPQLADVINKALARERDERFANVEAFALALEPFGQGLRFRGAGKGASVPAPALIPHETGGPKLPHETGGHKSVEPLATPFATSRSAKTAPPAQQPKAPESDPLRKVEGKKTGRTIGIMAAAAVLLAVGGFAWLKSSPSETASQTETVPNAKAPAAQTAGDAPAAAAAPKPALPSAPPPTGGAADEWETEPSAPPAAPAAPTPTPVVAAPSPPAHADSPSPAPEPSSPARHRDDSEHSSSERPHSSSRHSRAERKAAESAPAPKPETTRSRELMMDPRLELIGPR